jgi:hypothetical protein
MRQSAILGLLLLAGCKMESSPSETPNSSPPTDRADKVASILAANDITVGDVATFVHQYGYTVIPEVVKPWHWSPSAPGSSPVAYYVATIKVAVGDTTMAVWFRDRVVPAPYSVSVVAYDGNGIASPRSLLGWSNGTGAGSLPGVGQ